MCVDVCRRVLHDVAPCVLARVDVCQLLSMCVDACSMVLHLVCCTVLARVDVCRCVSMCVDVCRRVLHGVAPCVVALCWRVSMCVDVCRRVSMRAPWCFTLCVALCWRVSMCVDVCRCVSTCVDVCRRVSMCVDSCCTVLHISVHLVYYKSSCTAAVSGHLAGIKQRVNIKLDWIDYHSLSMCHHKCYLALIQLSATDSLVAI